MYASAKQLRDIENAVERRVRGKLLFRFHLGIAAIGTGLALVPLLLDSYGIYLGASARFTSASFMSVVYLFTFTLSIHAGIRWLNRAADRTRTQEIQRELAYMGYSGDRNAKVKRKSTDESVVFLSDDGELAFSEDDQETDLSATTSQR